MVGVGERETDGESTKGHGERERIGRERKGVREGERGKERKREMEGERDDERERERVEWGVREWDRDQDCRERKMNDWSTGQGQMNDRLQQHYPGFRETATPSPCCVV